MRPRALTFLRLIGALHGFRCRPAENDPVYAASSLLMSGLPGAAKRIEYPSPFFSRFAPTLPPAPFAVGIFARPGPVRPASLRLAVTLPGRSRLELPAHPELTPVWRKVRAELRRVVGESTYELWLAPLEATAWDGRVLSLEVPPDIGPWISRRFNHVIQRSVRAALGEETRVEFAPLHSQPPRSQQPPFREPPPFNPRYSFNQFIIGESNRLAHAASLAVAELPGQAYNPLFLHAPPGLGKTHLLHAIGNYVRDFGAGAVVRYTTA